MKIFIKGFIVSLSFGDNDVIKQAAFPLYSLRGHHLCQIEQRKSVTSQT